MSEERALKAEGQERPAEGLADEQGNAVGRVARWEELGYMLRKKRKAEDLTLEEAALKTGISPATLSRLERLAVGGVATAGPTPDTRTLQKAARWLGVPVEIVDGERTGTGSSVGDPGDTVDVVAAHLRADPNLNPETAAALAQAFRLIYEQFVGTRPGGEQERPTDDSPGPEAQQ